MLTKSYISTIIRNKKWYKKKTDFDVIRSHSMYESKDIR